MSRRGYSEESSELNTPTVLKREIPWDTYLTARLISDRDLQLIKRYDKATKESQASLLKEAGPAYAEAFLSVVRNVTKEDTVQYVLALLDDMLSEDSSRAQLFHRQSNAQEKQTESYSIFLRLLQRSDWFTQEKACRLLTAILESRPAKNDHVLSNGAKNGASSSTSSSSGVEGVLNTFVNWLCAQLRRPSHPSRSVLMAVSSLSHILRERSVRTLLLKNGGVPLLGPLLKLPSGGSPPNMQLLYEAALCIWQLTFLNEAAEVIANTSGVVASLVEIARTAQKEKVVRVSLNALKNLLLASGLDVGPEMVDSGLQKVVTQRKQQNWEDEDMKGLLDILAERLAENIQLLSSFDKYKREVLGGNLDWGPMHTSEQFWRDNTAKLEEKDFQIIRVLLKLLETSRDANTLAVGCNDVGQFISYHTMGRQIIGDLRGKELVMRLMMHPDPNVQKQALLCVQKIMLAKDKLQFLNAQNEQ